MLEIERADGRVVYHGAQKSRYYHPATTARSTAVEKCSDKMMLIAGDFHMTFEGLVICITKQNEHRHSRGEVVTQVEVCGVDGDRSRFLNGIAIDPAANGGKATVCSPASAARRRLLR